MGAQRDLQERVEVARALHRPLDRHVVHGRGVENPMPNPYRRAGSAYDRHRFGVCGNGAANREGRACRLRERQAQRLRLPAGSLRRRHARVPEETFSGRDQLNRLEGKVALITGAGSGIAKAASHLFAAEGARVVIAEIDREKGAATERFVNEAGGEALFVQTDVTNEHSAKRAVDAAVERFGKLDVLYNCAGGSAAEDAPVTQVDLAEWQRTMSLN